VVLDEDEEVVLVGLLAEEAAVRVRDWLVLKAVGARRETVVVPAIHWL